MRHAIESGGLTILASNEDRATLADAYRRGGYYGAESFVAQYFIECGLEMVRPEALLALTDMPLIAEDHGISDNNHFETSGRVWGFPDYCIIDPWERLKDTGRVTLSLVADYGKECFRVPSPYFLPDEFGAASAAAFESIATVWR